MTVSDLLRLAPFSLAIITLFLAAGGLFYSHAYGRYGDDAAIGFVARIRFAIAGAATLLVPVLMLVSFGRNSVPGWLTTQRAAGLVGFGVLATLATALYLLQSVGRPAAFLASVGRKVRVGRLNRYALSRRWRDPESFDEDLKSRQWQQWQRDRRSRPAGEWPGTIVIEGPSPAVQRHASIVMNARRLAIKMYRSDPSEMLFDAATAGLRNGNTRTWRAALEVIGRRLTSRKLSHLATQVVVENALALEEAAHRHSSEDCKVRIAQTLGEIGRARLEPEAASTLAFGISTLAERRLFENRPVNAAIDALALLARENPQQAVVAAQQLGQHLVPVLKRPAQIYGSDSTQPAHPTLKLFDLLDELARRAAKEGDGDLTTRLIDACGLIAQKLPGVQDSETVDALCMVLADAGVEAARRYGNREAEWHGTLDAARELRRLYDLVRNEFADPHGRDETKGSWLIERIAAIGSWALANRADLPALSRWRDRSDMGVQVAQQLSDLPPTSLAHPLHELLMRQHHQEIPHHLREEFIGICQRITGDLLALRVQLDVPGLDKSE
jgi:hypothetical protein